jgi:CheY-like chemotaxis protein
MIAGGARSRRRQRRPMTTHLRVALLGFSPQERTTLGGYLRMAASREPRYEQVARLDEADLMVADADHGPSEQLVLATDRLPDTVFVGTRAPADAAAWLPRPLDPLLVLRELDKLVALRGERRTPAPAGRARTVIQPRRSSRPATSRPSTIEVALGAAPSAPASGPPARKPIEAELPETRELDLPLLEDQIALPDAGGPAVTIDDAPQGPPALDEPEAPDEPAAPLALRALDAGESPAKPDPPRAATTVAPAEPSSKPAAPVAAPTPPATAAARDRHASPVALLVDDSEIALRFLQARLARFGISCHCAKDSTSALELLGQLEPDLVFLDMELGPASPLDGLALTRLIRTEWATRVPPLPVFMVTAHHGQLDRVRATLAGCDALLPKPLADAELDRLLARHGIRRALAD